MSLQEEGIVWVEDRQYVELEEYQNLEQQLKDYEKLIRSILKTVPAINLSATQVNEAYELLKGGKV